MKDGVISKHSASEITVGFEKVMHFVEVHLL